MRNFQQQVFSEGSKSKFEITPRTLLFSTLKLSTHLQANKHVSIQSIRNMAPKVAEKAVKQPAKKAPAAKKVVKKTAGGSKKKTKAVESYKIYIYKVLKQVNAHTDSLTVHICKNVQPSTQCSCVLPT